jgi:methyl-accepting chemotaxis protein
LRFYLLIVVVTMSLGGLGVWGLISHQASTVHMQALFDQASAAAAGTARLREALAETRRLEASLIAVGTSNALEVERLAGAWRGEIVKSNGAADALRPAGDPDPELAALVDQQKALLADYAAAIGPIADQLQAAKIDGPVALAYAAQAEDKAQALLAHSELIQRAQLAEQARLREQMVAGSELIALLRLALVGATLIIVVPLLWLTLHAVCRPIEQAVAVARRIAQGDLGQPVEVVGNDELSQLSRSLQDMQTSLRELVGQVRQAAQSIETASAEVAGGNLDLSQRTEQTAGNLQQTNGAIGLLSGAVTQGADAARQAHTLASSAADIAERGGSVVAQVVSTMDQINTSSRRIADIIGTIDGISFQTNILALNAAVEAARAGEQGRGFAVVASEVRGLAQRSAAAAREIKALIGASVERVGAGARLVQDAGSTMKDIVASVQRVSAIVGEISQAAGEQSGSLGEVHQAVGELDRMTQQNAALVEQSAAAADSLKRQAENLAGLVAAFRFDAAPAAAD